jgi:predicted ATPase
MLENLLEQVHLPHGETVPLLGALLGLPVPETHYPPLSLVPQRQRERTLETLVSLVLAQAAHTPMVMNVEDLHWADATTLAWLDMLLAQVATVPLLVVLTSRPMFAPLWGQHPRLTLLALQRLTRPQTARMIAQVAGGKRLPAEVLEQIIARTDGVPLFVEELTRMVLESGQLCEGQEGYELCGELVQLTIPATLHDSLMARLDRLGVGKAVAQWGAALGREFRYEVLTAVVPLDEAIVQDGLRQLVEADLMLQRGLLSQTQYRFKHALIQEAAYGSILMRRRQAMHQRIAQVLETRFAETTTTAPEVLARHYTAAGLPQQAVPAWQRASDVALWHSAYQEAIGHLTTALDLLASLPDSPAHRQHELELQRRLGAALRAIKGSPDAAVVQVYQRLRDLGQRAAAGPGRGRATSASGPRSAGSLPGMGSAQESGPDRLAWR